VVRADGDGLDVFLRADDMLNRVSKFLSQLAMGDKHKSDHEFPLLRKTRGPYRIAQEPSSGGKASWSCRTEVQVKNPLCGPALSSVYRYPGGRPRSRRAVRATGGRAATGEGRQSPQCRSFRWLEAVVRRLPGRQGGWRAALRRTECS